MSDIPRAEVERVLEELGERRGLCPSHGEVRNALSDVVDQLEALLKPKQYKVEWWVLLDGQGDAELTFVKPDAEDLQDLVAVRHYIDTLEHGEGIE